MGNALSLFFCAMLHAMHVQHSLMSCDMITFSIECLILGSCLSISRGGFDAVRGHVPPGLKRF